MAGNVRKTRRVRAEAERVVEPRGNLETSDYNTDGAAGSGAAPGLALVCPWCEGALAVLSPVCPYCHLALVDLSAKRPRSTGTASGPSNRYERY